MASEERRTCLMVGVDGGITKSSEKVVEDELKQRLREI
jgi:hypothetical protein